MKFILVLMSFLAFTAKSFAEDKKQGFCESTANMYKSVLADKIMDEIGVIQGYEAVETVKYSKEVKTMDNLIETFHYEIVANNGEGSWWASEYVVEIDTWLAGDGTATYCGLKRLNYLGVTKSGNQYE